jgi:hypothetical protein
MRIYISGPMTGIRNHNRGAFLFAELVLRAMGHEPVNPWRFGEVTGWDHFQYMRRDLAALATCQGIYMLPGWWRSRGAKVEWFVARVALGLKRIRT